jgi:putative oxidoreductase
MRKLDVAFAYWAPYVLSIVRVMIAVIFLEHGTQKLFGFPAPSLGPATALTIFSGLLELVGGLGLLLGLGTRLFAFLLSGEMAVAYFMVHAPRSIYPLLNRGELAAVYCFIFLYFAVAGGGPWSIDRLFHRRQVAAPSQDEKPTP